MDTDILHQIRFTDEKFKTAAAAEAFAMNAGQKRGDGRLGN